MSARKLKHLVIINGQPRAGKDTAIEFMRQTLARFGYITEAFSSIEPVRDMLTEAGFDLTRKTEADRALLSEVGNAVEKHSQFRTNACAQTIWAFFEKFEDEPMVMFIHMREPALIELLLTLVRVNVVTVLIKSPRASQIKSNTADRGVFGMKYDDRISNGGSLDDLNQQCEQFLYRQSLIDELSLLP